MSTFFVLLVVGFFLFRIINRNLDHPTDSTLGDNFPVDPIDEPEPEPAQPDYVEPEPVIAEEQPKTDPKPAPKPVQPVQKECGRLFGIIGKPLAHSASKAIFKKRFRNQHIDADYVNFELDSIDQLPELVSSQPNLCGLNITIPYKQEVMQYLDRLDESAESVGAVNVIKIVRNGEKTELIGYNTDCMAFADSIKPMVDSSMKALILGTGGVSKAVKHAFDQIGIESKFVSRNSNFEVLGYYELSPSIMDEFKIIVNCTPVGMWPNVNDCPDIPYTFLSSDHILYDVIYNPEETLFLKKGKEHGATVMGGTDMFELQAGATWDIWNS